MFMAIDQFGNTEHGLTYPRKELSEKYPGRINKMYSDSKSGQTFHVGYVIGQHWFKLFKVQEYRKAV
jgi:hypothetical protein